MRTTNHFDEALESFLDENPRCQSGSPLRNLHSSPPGYLCISNKASTSRRVLRTTNRLQWQRS